MENRKISATNLFKISVALFITLSISLTAKEKNDVISIKSPDGRIVTNLYIDSVLRFSVSQGGASVLEKSSIGMRLSDGTEFGKHPKLVSKKVRAVNEIVNAQFYRFSKFTDDFQEIDLKFKGGYGVIFRAYNDGVAYRFYSEINHAIEIAGEAAEFNFDKDYLTYLAHSKGKKEQFVMSFQNFYSVKPLSEADSRLAFLPAAVDLGGGRKLTITESDLESYPGMFLQVNRSNFNNTNVSSGQKSGKYSLKGVFAPIPSGLDRTGKRLQEVVTGRSDIIAKVKGGRSFPWRVLAITEKDTQLPVNNLVYALASPNRIGDCSWVKPGKVAWDWWNDWGLFNVGFKVGINQETYKYYIDFASRYGIEYVVLDEGWYNSTKGDLLSVIPELDMKELVEYGKSKNVGIVLWSVLKVLDDHLEEACKYYSELGIKGFKVDFLDRDDQVAVDMVYRVAEAAARHKLMLDFHGFYKPTGINRTFPNVVNFEGVFGLEELKWSTEKVMPEYDVTMPFIRMMAGPVDYTPGAMRNATKKDFAPIYSNPMSQGTRCHQLATYIVFDSPFTMLCDSPTLYEQNKECTEFIASIPMVYDETRILDGELAQFIITARRHEIPSVKGTDSGNGIGATPGYATGTPAGNPQNYARISPADKTQAIWSVGGLTNWNARDITLDLSFLEPGKTYKATLFKDGINSERQGADYSVEKLSVDSNTKLKIHMASGGGFALIISGTVFSI
ncbi:MAG: glycoside hydrolase family 97 protein [Rikenellaceae bacterium]|nr:glycoside hydrolase family 97 protein [Rikenellaceae bacterium]